MAALNNNFDSTFKLNINYNTLVSETKDLLKNMSAHSAKVQLIKRGYEEDKVESAIHQTLKTSKFTRVKNSSIVLFKDFFDKVGYGFSSPLLLYVLLYTINAPLILFGIIAALKSFLTLFTSSLIKKYKQKYSIKRKNIATFGTIFGLIFLLIAAAKSLNSTMLFAFGILLSSVFVVIHGDLYSDYVIKKLSSARSTITAKAISYFGLIITAIAFVIAGAMLDYSAITINLGITVFTIPGYLLQLEIVALAFILSSYAFSFVKPDLEMAKDNFLKKKETGFLTTYFQELKKDLSNFWKNKDIRTIFYGALFSGSFQTIIATFSGIYLFESVRNTVNNPFFHISLIFGIGIIAAAIGPGIARSFAKIFGQTPMLIFGVFLIAIFPLSIFFNVSYYALIIAHGISVIGASILSIVQSFILHNTLNEEEKKTYFSAITPMIAVIMPILIMLMTAIIFIFSFKQLFLVITVLILVLVVPFYFRLVIKAHKKHAKGMFGNSLFDN